MEYDVTVAGDQPVIRLFVGIPPKGSPMTQCACLKSRRHFEAELGTCKIVPRKYKTYDELITL